VSIWHVEVRIVEDVEEFSAELVTKSLRDASVLGDIEVEVDGRRSNEGVASQVSDEETVCVWNSWRCETTRIQHLREKTCGFVLLLPPNTRRFGRCTCEPSPMFVPVTTV
jgi:hypothetical protein